jgi:hypothetical protein
MLAVVQGSEHRGDPRVRTLTSVFAGGGRDGPGCSPPRRSVQMGAVAVVVCDEISRHSEEQMSVLFRMSGSTRSRPVLASALWMAASFGACDGGGDVCHFQYDTGFSVRLRCPSDVRLLDTTGLEVFMRDASDGRAANCPQRIHQDAAILCNAESVHHVTFDCEAWPDNPDVEPLFRGKREIDFEFEAVVTELDGTSWRGSSTATWKTSPSGCKPIPERLVIEMSETPVPAQ